MIIFLEKFGQTLISRPAGKEAFLAFQPTLRELAQGEEIVVDFQGVNVLAPSWADEFLTPLRKQYDNRIHLKNTENASVRATLKILNEVKNQE